MTTQTIENYIPQDWVEKFKTSKIVWLITCFIATIWLALIVSKPIFEAEGIKSVSQPIYRFLVGFVIKSAVVRFIITNILLPSVPDVLAFMQVLLGLLVYPIFRKLENVEPFRVFGYSWR